MTTSRLSTAGGDTGSSLGRYRVIANIGSGGMADVFLAVTQSAVGFNKLVVVKRMRPNLTNEESEHARMFIDEARLAARLSHPNVVQTHEVGTHDGMLFMVMEYLEGQSLKRIQSDATSFGRVPVGVAVRIVCDALAGLNYAHELSDYGGDSLGVVHRDVSPHNILVTYDGVAKVLDFGIAKATLNSTQTQAGVFKGKANYMAPEQAALTEIDRRADVFAAGILLFELVTGERLFPGQPMQALHLVVSKEVPLASTVRGDVHPELEAIIARALERDVEDRFQTADAMRNALETYAQSRAIGATQQAVREYMNGRFADPRVQTRKRIDDEIKSLRASGEVPAVSIDSLADFSGALPSIEVGAGTISASQPRGGTGSVSQHGQPATSLTGSFNAQPAAMRMKIIAVVGGLAVLTCALGLYIGTHRSVEPTAPAAVPSIVAPPAPPPSLPLDAANVVAPAQGSFVTLVSDPTGASVELDGKPVGTTPLGLPLSNPGSHVVFRMSKDGYQAGTIELTVPGTTDKPAIASLTLKPIPGAKAPAHYAGKAADKKAPEPVVAAPTPDVPPPAVAAPEPPKPATSKPSVMTLDDVTGKPKVKVVE